MALPVLTGLWYDYSKPNGFQATLTLEIDHANILLSTLTFLVTVAAASFWNLTALFLHRQYAQTSHPDHVDLQHRILLRNSSTASGSLVAFVKIFLAWRRNRVPNLLKRSLRLILPAAIVLTVFSAASVLVSRVANKSYAGTLARLQPNRCGTLLKKPDDSWETNSWYFSKELNDSLARAYAKEYYLSDERAPTSQSIHPRESLPFSTQKDAPCPFPNATRCQLGINGAFSMISDFIDSSEMLGINAVPEDRISLQMNFTCSPLMVKDLVTESKLFPPSNLSYISINMGSSSYSKVNETSYIFLKDPEDSMRSYSLVPLWNWGIEPIEANQWRPISDFNRTNAEVSAYLLKRQSILYWRPVHDPLFAATTPKQGLFVADNDLAILGCAQQYRICKGDSTNRYCTSPGTWQQTKDAVKSAPNHLSLNGPQLYTSIFSLASIYYARPETAVSALREHALFANDVLNANVSPPLPDTQWQIEVQGWFQTMLAQLQHAILVFVTKAQLGPTSGATLWDPFDPTIDVNRTKRGKEQHEWMRYQCYNQLVRTTGQVQNFSFLGVMFIVGASLLIILLDLCLEAAVDLVQMRLRGYATVGMVARRADKNLQLLRRAFVADNSVGGDGKDEWLDGFMGVPVHFKTRGTSEMADVGTERSDEYQGGLFVIGSPTDEDRLLKDSGSPAI